MNYNNKSKKPIHKRTWFIILMLFLFFPVGLILVWKNSDWKKPAKLIVTIITSIFVVNALATNSDDDKTPVIAPTTQTIEMDVSQTTIAPTLMLTPEPTINAEEIEKIEREKAEAERIAAEQSEAERIAAEQAEAERVAAEQAEAERVAAEQAEAERIAKEQAEAERIAKEQEKERKAKEAEEKKVVETNKQSGETVWIGDSGKKYHRKSCSTLSGNKYEITLQEAKAEGREACKRCKP